MPKPPLQEFVAGGAGSTMPSQATVLTRTASKVPQVGGTDVYDRMALDPVVASCIATLANAVVADGVAIEPICHMPSGVNPDPQEVADAEQAALYAEFVQRCFRRMEDAGQALVQVALDLLQPLIIYGNVVAERVLEIPESGEDAGKLCVRAIKPKSPTHLAYVVDPYMNVLGISATQPASNVQAEHGQTGTGDGSSLRSFVPRDRFVIGRLGGKWGDPRGDSLLDAAYSPWYFKTCCEPEYFKWLLRFASPSIVGKTPENAINPHLVDEDGNLVDEVAYETPEQRMMKSLVAFQSASAIVVPFGAEVALLEPKSDGSAFATARAACDRAIATGILGSSRSILESEHGSKADSGQAQDILGLRIQMLRRVVAEVIDRDIMRPLIAMNWGEDALKYAPRISFAGVEQQDRVALIEAYAKAYASGFVHDSQLPAMMQEVGLPPPDMEAIQAEKEQAAQNARLSAGDLGRLVDPASQLQD